MKKIKGFKIFEGISKKKFMSNGDIKNYFLDLIDNGYVIHFYSSVSHYNGKYFLTLKKDISEESIGYISKGNSYGFTNIERIKDELEIFDRLEESKKRLKSSGYTIGYEFECNISSEGQFVIVCHVQHSSFD